MNAVETERDRVESVPSGISQNRVRLETLCRPSQSATLCRPTQTAAGSLLGDSLLRLSRQERSLPDTAEPVMPPTSVAKEDTPPTKNRRRFPRHESGCRVQFHRCGINAPHRWSQKDWLLHATSNVGILCDVSMAGLAFSYRDSLEVDETIMLRISSPKLGTQVDTVGRVMRSTDEGDANWTIYCKLDRKLTLDQIQPLRLQFSSNAVV